MIIVCVRMAVKLQLDGACVYLRWISFYFYFTTEIKRLFILYKCKRNCYIFNQNYLVKLSMSYLVLVSATRSCLCNVMGAIYRRHRVLTVVVVEWTCCARPSRRDVSESRAAARRRVARDSYCRTVALSHCRTMPRRRARIIARHTQGGILVRDCDARCAVGKFYDKW